MQIKDFTSYVNKSISRLRSDTNVMGVDFLITPYITISKENIFIAVSSLLSFAR